MNSENMRGERAETRAATVAAFVSFLFSDTRPVGTEGVEMPNVRKGDISRRSEVGTMRRACGTHETTGVKEPVSGAHDNQAERSGGSLVKPNNAVRTSPAN